MNKDTSLAFDPHLAAAIARLARLARLASHASLATATCRVAAAARRFAACRVAAAEIAQDRRLIALGAEAEIAHPARVLFLELGAAGATNPLVTQPLAAGADRLGGEAVGRACADDFAAFGREYQQGDMG